MRKKPQRFLGTWQKCKDGMLPSAKRIMVESKEKLMWHLWGGPSLLCYFLGGVARCVSNSMMSYVIAVSFSLYGNGKIIFFVDTKLLLSGLYPFPLWTLMWFICMFCGDSPCYLVLLLADCTITYDVYSTPIWGTGALCMCYWDKWCCPFLLGYQLVKGEMGCLLLDYDLVWWGYEYH